MKFGLMHTYEFGLMHAPPPDLYVHGYKLRMLTAF